MLIYMQHKEHGNHIVYSEADAVECEKNGWVRAPFPTAKKEEPELSAPRRGRPPKVE